MLITINKTAQLTVNLCNIAFLTSALADHDLEHNANVDIVQLKYELRKQSDLANMLLKRLDAQEKQIQHLSDRISEQDRIIAKQAEQISILESRDNINEEYLTTKQDNNTSSDITTSIKGNVESKGSINTEPRHPRMTFRPRIRAFQEGPVAFHATINSANDIHHISLGQKLVFDKVKLSVGGGYHSQFGLFIAPMAGIYIFSVSALSTDHSSLEVALKKNGVTLALSYASSHGEGTPYEQGSVTVVTQLAVGDEVYAVNTWPDNTSLRTDDFTSFMGCLVTEI